MQPKDVCRASNSKRALAVALRPIEQSGRPGAGACVPRGTLRGGGREREPACWREDPASQNGRTRHDRARASGGGRSGSGRRSAELQRALGRLRAQWSGECGRYRKESPSRLYRRGACRMHGFQKCGVRDHARSCFFRNRRAPVEISFVVRSAVASAAVRP